MTSFLPFFNSFDHNKRQYLSLKRMTKYKHIWLELGSQELKFNRWLRVYIMNGSKAINHRWYNEPLTPLVNGNGSLHMSSGSSKLLSFLERSEILTNIYISLILTLTRRVQLIYIYINIIDRTIYCDAVVYGLRMLVKL